MTLDFPTFVVLLRAATFEATNIQKFIFVLIVVTSIATTLQRLIVVVSAATVVATTVAIIVMKEGREDPKTCFKFAENWICTS